MRTSTSPNRAKNWFRVAFGVGVILIVAGWLVDYNLGGDPHLLDGIGYAIVVLTTCAAAVVPTTTASGLLTPKRKVVLASLLLAIAAGSVVHAFIASRIVIGREATRLVESPLRETVAVVTFFVVLTLARTVLLRVGQISPSHRHLAILMLSGWALASSFAAIVSAGALTLLLWSQETYLSGDLVLAMTFVAGLILTLSTTRMLVPYCGREAV
jgi:hypothetical protein